MPPPLVAGDSPTRSPARRLAAYSRSTPAGRYPFHPFPPPHSFSRATVDPAALRAGERFSAKAEREDERPIGRSVR